MRDIPQEPWTEDAHKYVQKINESNTEYAMGSNVKYKNLENSLQLFTGVKDIDTDDDFGSTDVGDVSQITPVTGGRYKDDICESFCGNLGLMALGVLQNSMPLLGVSPYVQALLLGIIIVAIR